MFPLLICYASPHRPRISSSTQHSNLSSCEIRAALYSKSVHPLSQEPTVRLPTAQSVHPLPQEPTCVLDVMLVDGGQYFTVCTQLKDPPVTCDTNPRGASRILAKNFRTTVGVQVMPPLCWSAEAQSLQPLLLVIVLLPGELQVFSLLRVIPGPLEGS